MVRPPAPRCDASRLPRFSKTRSPARRPARILNLLSNIRSSSGLRSPRRRWRHLARAQRSCAPTPRRPVVGIGGDLEHGAAMIHPRLGMAMRRAIKRGRVIIPGHAKVGPPGTTVDLIYGPLDDAWDLDAFDSTPVLIHDPPRPHEIVLWVGYAMGPRINARCKGPDQKEVDELVASFAKG